MIPGYPRHEQNDVLYGTPSENNRRILGLFTKPENIKQLFHGSTRKHIKKKLCGVGFLLRTFVKASRCLGGTGESRESYPYTKTFCPSESWPHNSEQGPSTLDPSKTTQRQSGRYGVEILPIGAKPCVLRTYANPAVRRRSTIFCIASTKFEASPTISIKDSSSRACGSLYALPGCHRNQKCAHQILLKRISDQAVSLIQTKYMSVRGRTERPSTFCRAEQVHDRLCRFYDAPVYQPPM